MTSIPATVTTPCREALAAGNDHWTSDDPESRKLAAKACLRCPARFACAELAIERRENAHVYAGRDLSDWRQRRELAHAMGEAS